MQILRAQALRPMLPAPRLTLTLVGKLALGFYLGACASADPPADETSSDDANCPEGTLGCPCFPNDSCFTPLVCDASICEEMELEGSESGIEAGSSGDGDGDGNGGDCTMHGQPDPACTEGDSIFCDDVEPVCVTCGELEDPDAGCSSLGAGTDWCTGMGCTECVTNAHCAGSTPICAPAQYECVACNDHSECPDSACNLETGACMEGAPVFYVHGDLGDDGTGDGSAGSPFATIGHALGLVPFQGQGVVRVAAASAPYLESVDIEFRTVALLGDGMPVINPGLGFGVGVNSARAFVSGFRIHSSDYPKARCLDGVFFLENAVMHNGSSDGVYIGADCAAALRNVMVSGHSGTTLDRREIRADGPTSVHYSTIVGGATDLPGIECGALGTIDFRNTLFIEESGQLTTNCPGATFEHSGVLTTAGVDRPSGVVDLGPFEFEYFDIVYPGEYKVSGDGQGTPFGGLAELGPGDPYFDYEHDPRPSDGFIGADQPY